MKKRYCDPDCYEGCPHETEESVIDYISRTSMPRKHFTTNKEKIAELVKWLYINDRSYESADEWKTALIKKLEELFI